MNIQLDEQTKNWLQAKGKPLAVKMIHVNPCCAPSVEEVTTHLGKPKDMQRYYEIEKDGVTIYVEKPITAYQNMTLKVKGIGFFKMVAVRLT